MFRKNYSPIGLEVGETSLRMLQLEKIGDRWRVAHRIRVELPVDDEEKEKEEAVPAGILREALKKGNFSGKAVVSSMPQELLDILPLKLSLAGEEEVEEAVVREARNFLSYDLDEAVIDYLVVKEESFGAEQRRILKVLLIAAKREDVETHLALLRQCGLRPVAIEIPACALARIFRIDNDQSGRNLLIVNLKEKSTSLTVLCDGQVLLDRNVFWGRDTLQVRLADQLQLDARKAAALLERIGVAACRFEEKNEGGAGGDDTEQMAGTVCEIITPELEVLAEEMEKVFIYFSAEMRGDQIDALSLAGLSGSIRDLDRYLQQRLGLPTRIVTPGERLGLTDGGGKPEGDKEEDFCVALGLALRGCDMTVMQKARVEEDVAL